MTWEYLVRLRKRAFILLFSRITTQFINEFWWNVLPELADQLAIASLLNHVAVNHIEQAQYQYHD